MLITLREKGLMNDSAVLLLGDIKCLALLWFIMVIELSGVQFGLESYA